MKVLSSNLFLSGAILISGCTSVDVYVPKTVGSIPHQKADGEVTLRIDTSDNFVVTGEKVTFSVTLKNNSAKALWLPEDPQLTFAWTYPNGSRDNFLQDPPQPSYYDQDTAVQLEPGQEMTRRTAINTDHFTLDGVTEFRAVLEVAANKNPNLRPFWSGRAVSNGYGIAMAREAGKLTELQNKHTQN